MHTGTLSTFDPPSSDDEEPLHQRAAHATKRYWNKGVGKVNVFKKKD